MQLQQALDEYRYAILDHSPNTQRWYLQKLTVFVEWCQAADIPELEALRPASVRRFLTEVRERTNPQTHHQVSSYTVHGYAQVIKGFLSWCVKDELIASKLPEKIEMPRVDVKVIETFTPDHIKRLFAASTHELSTELVARDKAILALLLDTGIRATELCGLTLEGVSITPYDAFVRVFGKGRKEREVGLGKQSRTTLHRYITRYRHAPKDEQHVFLARTGTPLTTDGLYQIISRLGEWGRVKGVRCSPHTARHTFAVTYLQAGGDLYKLSRLLGHTSVSTTENYLRAFKARDARKDGPSVLDLTITP